MKYTFMMALLAVTVTASIAQGAEIKSSSGARASVSAQYAGKFQALITWLDNHGYKIRFMGGYRPGKCWSGGMHPCGKAIDINQTGRGRIVASFPAGVDEYARTLGLVPGSGWCNQDRGHFQVGGHDGCFRAGKNNLFRRYAESRRHPDPQLPDRHTDEQ